MSVRLISVTPNAEETILYCARASSDQENTDAALLGYLIRNKHWSPFEMAHLVMEFVTSRAIAQQILRHRSFSFQEFSQRYATPERAFIYMGRTKATKNRQSSIDNLDERDQQWWLRQQKFLSDQAFEVYHQALDRGIAKECARFVLPVSTETKLYMAGSVRSWIHYLEQRTDGHTQEEHRQLALGAERIFAECLPITHAALKEGG